MKHVIILGAGPAGLTAALELTQTSDIRVSVIEQEHQVGGISRTIVHNGNRMDIGGHRFFSKSDLIMGWWKDLLPPQGEPARGDPPEYHSLLTPGGPNPETDDLVLLARKRLSRIYYQRHFYDYPVRLNLGMVRNLGPARIARMGLSYARALLHPVRPERNLEDFFINRFGRELYGTFFRDYTEKVWGRPCTDIASAWGTQRVKGLSVLEVLRHAVKSMIPQSLGDMRQKNTETSLIDSFYYPKYGPGQLWEEAARRATVSGATLYMEHRAVGLERDGDKVNSVRIRNLKSGDVFSLECDAVISSAPIKELMRMLAGVPDDILRVSDGLLYRDFISVGLLADHLLPSRDGTMPADNWIYIQEPDVHLGRLQIFNNWSPYMVSDAGGVWLGQEYFADEGDCLWTMPDGDFIRMAANELSWIGILPRSAVRDATLLRVKKAYPAYFGAYEKIGSVEHYLDGIINLYPVGRNGMHRYNNMDHSMLSAMAAVDCIIRGADKRNIWLVNSEKEYHESSLRR
jgi:protoporphyrinogen oxidase